MPVRIPSYYQIHFRERQIIERLYAQGFTPEKIARQVFRSRSTITWEIQRNGYPDKKGQWQYSAKITQRFCEHRQRRTGSTRGPNKLHKREPSANYVHTTPLLPVFRIRIHRGFHIDLKRWMRKYKLSKWHENYFGKAWRQSNNWLHNRCYSCEEMGRRFKKSYYVPSTFHSRKLARLRRRLKNKPQYKVHWRIPAPNKLVSDTLSGYRSGKKQIHYSFEPFIVLKGHLKNNKRSLQNLYRGPVQRPHGITMSRNRLNQRFFKIPASG